MKKPSGRNSARRLLRHAPVALEHVRALDLDHADLVRRQFLAGVRIGDAGRHAGQRQADGARHPVPVIRVGGVHVGLGHAVALKDGMTGAGAPLAVGLGQQRSRARHEQPHAGCRLFAEAGMLKQAHVEGGNAHQGRGTGHQPENLVGVELRQEDHRRRREAGDSSHHEQPVGVVDRQGMDQHVIGREAPHVLQGQGIGDEIVVSTMKRPALRRRHPGLVGAPGREAEQVAQTLPDVRDAREHEQIGADCLRLREVELGIARRILRVAVVLPVEHAIVAVRPERQEAGDRAEGHVEPAAAERRSMCGLVEGAEEEGQRVAVQDDQRHDPRGGSQQPDQRPRDDERAEMARRPGEPRTVGARHDV